MITTSFSSHSSNGIARPSNITRNLSDWTNGILSSVSNIVSDYETSIRVRAHTKIMSLMAASLHTSDGVQSVSAKFSDGLLREVDAHMNTSFTTQSVRAITSAESAEIAKDSILSQLLNHELAPLSYTVDDDSFVIDFTSSPSRLTCIFDDEGIQFMWIGPNGPVSEFVRTETINASQLVQKVAMILYVSEHAH